MNHDDDFGEDENGILNNYIEVPRSQASPIVNLLNQEDDLNQRRFQDNFNEDVITTDTEESQK